MAGITLHAPKPTYATAPEDRPDPVNSAIRNSRPFFTRRSRSAVQSTTIAFTSTAQECSPVVRWKSVIASAFPKASAGTEDQDPGIASRREPAAAPPRSSRACLEEPDAAFITSPLMWQDAADRLANARA